MRLREYLYIIIYKLFMTQLYLLSSNDRLLLHIRAQAKDKSYQAKNEFLQFVRRCFALAHEMLRELPEKKFDVEHEREERVDTEKLALKTTFIFNLLAVCLRHG